jgi:hypothetical protein
MLTKPQTTPRPATSFAHTGDYKVRLATGIACPHCERELTATDIVADFAIEPAVQIVCPACHRDILIVGAGK